MGSSPATEKSISDSSLPIRIASMRNSRAVRWYVLALPSRHRGAAKGLQAELDRRLRNGEPAFEYFAPTYVEVREEKGVWVKTARPLLYNYVFVRSSENEIYKMMSTAGLSLYSFLPRVRDGKREYYPYLSDEAMENLRWVARSYADIVPVYTPEPKRLMKGDRVRITEGKFKNAEATVISQPGGGRKDIMVCVENWLWVPLLHVHLAQYGQYARVHASEQRPVVRSAARSDAAASCGRGDLRRPSVGHRNIAAIRQPADGFRRDALQTLCATASGLHDSR